MQVRNNTIIFNNGAKLSSLDNACLVTCSSDGATGSIGVTGATGSIGLTCAIGVTGVNSVNGAIFVTGAYHSDYLYWNSKYLKWKTYGSSVHIGSKAGCAEQGIGSVAIGPCSGETNQGDYAIALGFKAGKTVKSSK